MADPLSFDMNRAWDEMKALLSANRQVVLVVAGVFFFLPNLAIMLLVPDLGEAVAGAQTNDDGEAAAAAVLEILSQYWWAFALVALLQAIGSLGLLSLLGQRGRPTLGEALRNAMAGLLPYFAANILVGLGFMLAVFFLAAIFALTGIQALAVLPVLFAIPLLLWIMTRTSLTGPVVAVEGVRNPIGAIARSWRMTKSNTLKLLPFYFLLLVAMVVLSIVFSLVTGLVFALFGPKVSHLGESIVSSIANAVFVAVLLAAFAAAHRQLSGHATRASVPRVPRQD